MDYRLQSVLDACKSRGSRAKTLAEQYRANVKGADEVDHSTEVIIAREQGHQAAYEWCAAQLESFEIEPAGGTVPPLAPPLGGTGNESSARPLREAKQLAKYALDAAKSAKSNGQNYGWSDARYYVNDVITYLGQIQTHLEDL